MTKRNWGFITGFSGLAVIAVAVFFVTAQAQEGHPLKGSWIGQWEGNSTHGNSVLLVLDWDGQRISGIINPGTQNIPIGNATLDPDNWTVRIEASADNVRYVIEGQIENLALSHRSISGTWRNERGNGAFEVQRQ
jgi:hypothetical protein